MLVGPAKALVDKRAMALMAGGFFLTFGCERLFLCLKNGDKQR